MRGEAVEVGLRRECPGIPPTHAFDATQRRVGSCNVGKCAKATLGRDRCELLRLPSDSRIATIDHEAIDKSVETRRNKGRAEVH